MKKKIELNKKTIKRLNLKLEAANDRKVAPASLIDSTSLSTIDSPTNGNCISSHPISVCL